MISNKKVFPATLILYTLFIVLTETSGIVDFVFAFTVLSNFVTF